MSARENSKGFVGGKASLPAVCVVRDLILIFAALRDVLFGLLFGQINGVATWQWQWDLHFFASVSKMS